MSVWRKSSRSGGHADQNCVEVADLSSRDGRVIGLRDSKNPDGPRLRLTPAEWNALLTTIKTTCR